MKKIDIILAIITGLGVGFLFSWLLKNSKFYLPFLSWTLPLFFPFLALFCLWIAYLIGKKYLFVYQLAKFLLIGACFAIFDLIILNILMERFGIRKEEELKYALFVTISFVIATTAKYIFDKYWAFEQKEKRELGKEFLKFFIITLISGGIQVGSASLIFSAIAPFFVNELIAGNIGKIGGITLASAWNFVGYKFFVFKK